MTGALTPRLDDSTRNRVRDKLRKHWADAAAVDSSPEELAVIVGEPVDVLTQVLLGDAELQVELASDAERKRLLGETLRPKAAALLEACLVKLRTAVDADELDASELMDLVPKLHRILEHRDRVDEARNGTKSLAVVHLNFIGDSMTVKVAQPEARALQDEDVIDVDAHDASHEGGAA